MADAEGGQVKLRVTVVTEYEPEPEHYGTDDPAEMARIDAENWNEDVMALLATFDSFDVRVEVIE